MLKSMFQIYKNWEFMVGGKNWPFVLNFVACNKLKESTLTDILDKDKWFLKQISEFPAPKVLVMNDSYI